ncbi:hypothetical protein [Streptomyces sp. NPDC004008]
MTSEHATITVHITYNPDQIQARDLIANARIGFGDALGAMNGVTGWQTTATTEPATEEPARRALHTRTTRRGDHA